MNWSQGIRVNQDALNNGKLQFLPAIRVDEEGGINVIYYDNRNISSDSCEIFLSRSVDAGNTWNDYLISNHRFMPKSISGAGAGNQGDNIGITSANGKLFPVWMDDHTGVYQVWTAIIDYSSIGVNNISTEIPEKFQLMQNFPNPFNPSTIINYKLAVSGFVRLAVFDISGREIALLVNENQQAGDYNAEWNAHGFPSGVYFYKLETDVFSESKKMVLLK
jgi:hypothetical protein